MRRGTPLALLLICGCVLPGSTRPDGTITSLKPAMGPLGPDVVGLEVAVLEVPVGDRFANGGLWESIDEQVVALDRKAALDDNGFRVGLVGGVRPAGFDELLKSPRSNPGGHFYQVRAGHTRTVTIGGPRSVLEFRLVANNVPGSVTAIEKVQAAVQITPTLEADGAIKLAFVPLVQHGSRPVWLAPIAGDEPEVPADRYPAIGWEVMVAAGEFVVVGARFEKMDTLGRACFIDPDPAKPVQRLLAVRGVRFSG